MRQVRVSQHCINTFVGIQTKKIHAICSDKLAQEHF